MEAEDAPPSSTPEWRPRSSISESTERSSIVPLSHLPAPLKRVISHQSSEKSGVRMSKSEAVDPPQDIAPNEASICDRLIEGIKDFHASTGQDDEQQDTALSFTNLESALRYTASMIQYHAKWFSERGLETLLDVALNAAASSSASAELFAAIHLINTVTIYSLLPSHSLDVVVRFLCQTYYSASRAYKTKKLAEATWSTLQTILDSHLGTQTATTLLEVLSSGDETLLESRAGYAQFAGALKIVSDKLPPFGDALSTLPSITFTEIIDAVWPAIVNGTDSIREIILEQLASCLADDVAARDLNEQSSWDLLLETIEPCVTLTPDAPAAKTLVETLLSKYDYFEPRNVPLLANLAIDMNLPLTPELAMDMLQIWEEVLPTRDIPNAFARLLKKLCRSSLYATELSALVERSILEIFLVVPTSKSLTAFIHTIQDLAMDPATTDEAADILTKALVMMLRRSVRFAGRESEQTTLFQALCQVSKRCIAAAEVLFSIRADANGTVYVESGLLSHTFPAHSDAFSMSAVMHDASTLPLQDWHDVIITVLQGSVDWKIYQYFLSRLPSLLGNHPMFDSRIDFVKDINVAVSDLLHNGVYPELPTESGFTKSDVTVALLQILTSVLSYHHHLSKQESLGIVSTLLSIAGSRDYTVSIACIHALTICCYELPGLMTSCMDDVIDKMSKLVTQRYLAIHVLLFLAGLSRQPSLFHNFQTHDFKKIFGVCGSYLRSIRGTSALTERSKAPINDQSSGHSSGLTDALPQYVYALAHHVIAFWYLALRAQDRSAMKEHITSFLKYTSADGAEKVEDQGLVTIDLMDRVDATDLEGSSAQPFDDGVDGRTVTMHRLNGVLLLTTTTALRTGKTVLTVRRPTGTEVGVLQISPGEPDSLRYIAITVDGTSDDFICVFPADTGGCTYGRILVPSPTSVLGSKTTLNLPADDEGFARAIQQFDRTFALDSHKAGVIYVGDGQTTEDEILQNCMGSPDYIEFVHELGNLMRLKNATFNPQGLDRVDDADGQHTVVWQNSLTELVFHITTFMPNIEGDISVNTASKKKHIGNDYVNIIFNNSGSSFNFDTFPSQFNFVYIVITPAARTSFIQTRIQNAPSSVGEEASDLPVAPASSEETRPKPRTKTERFYAVQVLTRPGYPAVSSAAEEKIISGASLPQYVRNLALNECILALMWAYRDEPGEYPSSWRSRLGQIRRLWERYG